MFLYMYYHKTWTLSQGTADNFVYVFVLREDVSALEWLEEVF